MVAAAQVWIGLPEAVVSSSSLQTFCSQLKTHLFQLSYPHLIFWPFDWHRYSGPCSNVRRWEKALFCWKVNIPLVGWVVQLAERRSLPANWPCAALGLQLTGDHYVGKPSAVGQLGQLSLSSFRVDKWVVGMFIDAS